MLETLGTTNIGRLNIEEPRAETPQLFDPEKDISLLEWGFILGSLDNILQDTWAGQKTYLEDLRDISLLSPRTFTRFRQITPSERVVGLFKNLTQTMLDEEEWGSTPLVSTYSYNTQLRPFFPGLELPIIRPSDWQNWRFQLREFQKEKDLTDFLLLGSSMRLAAPYINLRLENEEQTWDIVKKTLEQNSSSTEGYFMGAARARILFPTRFKELTIKKSDWQGAHYLLHDLISGSHPDNGLAVATAMQILAAEDLEITYEGLKLTMPESEPVLNLPTPALPETRKF